jgi:DNA-binding MarR family transcriptional regulator
MNQEESIIFHLAHLYKVINNRANILFQESGYPIRIEQVPVLMTLHYQGSLSQQEVANYLSRDKSSIQRTVVSLLRNGLVTVSNDSCDKRKNIVTLSGYGKTLSTKLETDISEIECLLFDHIGHGARQKIIDMIHELDLYSSVKHSP